MARIGYKKAKYNIIDKATNKYKAIGEGGVPRIIRVIEEKSATEFNNAALYADDVIAESDYSFKKGTLTITKADDDDELDAILLGNTDTDGEVVSNIKDVAPEIGYGHIVTKLVQGVRSYKVEFFPRVKITKVTTDAKTRGESVEFGTTTVEGEIYAVEVLEGFESGDWEKHKTFTTEAAAEAYLDSLLTPATPSV